MGKGTVTRRVLRTAAARQRRPPPPAGTDGDTLLRRVREHLTRLRQGGHPEPPTAAERRVLDWLQYELQADAEMDRDPHYAEMYEAIERGAPRILDGIQHPETVLGGGARYPLDTGEVVTLLRGLGVSVDEAGSAVRRLGDAFRVPQVGSSRRRVFFARHVLRVAFTHGAAMSDTDVRNLVRHITGDLTPAEAIVARAQEDVPRETELLLARARAPQLPAVSLHFRRR